MIRTLIYIGWAVMGVVWLIGAFYSKPTARTEASSGRALHLMGTFLAFYLLFDRSGTIPAFNARFVPGNAFTAWTGLALTVAGIAFAIDARLTLGRNWSTTVTMKQGHKLVRHGPYRFVRHPIYSGALLAILGTAIAFGEWRGLGAFVIALAAWRRKTLTEERFMLELFGEDYRVYQREVKALIPGLF